MKRIELILKDNIADGALKYLITSETTIGYKIPRDCIDRYMDDLFYTQLKSPGVYVLVGKRLNDNHKSIYIGQSDNVAKRLYEHKGGQDGEKQTGKLFWSECLAFVTSDNQMQKGHAEYLEFEFYKKAYDSNRYILENENMPSIKCVSEGDKIFCDDFVYDCDLLLELMGIPIFKRKNKSLHNEIIESSERHTIYNGNRCGYDCPKYVNATGYFCSTSDKHNGFVVLENSIITKDITKKAGNTVRKTRRDLIKRGYIKEENGKLIFKREFIFTSAGIAASVVLGRQASAKEWK